MEEKKKNPELRFEGFTNDWEIKPLENIAEIIMGSSPKSANYNDKKVGLPLLQGNADIKERISYPRIYTSEVTKECEPGDILLSVRAPVGTVAKSIHKACIGRGISAIRSKENNSQEYLYQWMYSFESSWEKISQGGTFDAVNSDEIKQLNIPIPVAVEQQQIGSFFKNIDELITKHQNKHKRLVTLKKSMLEKMFPKEGQSVPEIRFKGFEGDWEIDTLNELGKTYTGLSGKTKKDFGHGDAKYITYMNVFSNAIADPSLTDFIEVDNSQNCVEYGDVLFTVSSETPEEVGFTSVWTQNEKNVYLNSFCFGYRPAKKFYLTFLANALRSSAFRKQIIILAQGISRFNISKTKVIDLELCFPDYKEQVKIGLWFKNIDELINSHKNQLEKLKNFKQSLSEKMFV